MRIYLLKYETIESMDGKIIMKSILLRTSKMDFLF